MQNRANSYWVGSVPDEPNDPDIMQISCALPPIFTKEPEVSFMLYLSW